MFHCVGLSSLHEVIWLANSQLRTQYWQLKNIFPNWQCWKQKLIQYQVFQTWLKCLKKQILFCLEKQNSQLIVHCSLVNQREILSFKDIHYNGYHIETDKKNGIEYDLYIISTVSNEKYMLERLAALSFGLYYTSYTSNWNICNNEPKIHESKYICNLT